MKTYIDLIVLFLISGVVSMFLIPLFAILAKKTSLVDKPNYRKVHVNAVPLIGGISIAVSVLFALILNLSFLSVLKEHLFMLISAYVLLIMGVIDDRFDLKATYKLAVQLLLAYLVTSNGIRITSFYGVLGIYELPVIIQYALTIIVITGVINAYNLMDGIDGLAGTLSFIGILSFSALAFLSNQTYLVMLLVSIAGAILGFLKKNLSKDKVFMGDAGSLFLGFILAVSGIKIMNVTSVVEPSYSMIVFLIVIGVFSIPVLDSVRVYRERMSLGYSPFKADRRHLHHLFLFFDISHKKATLYISIFAVVMLLSVVLLGLVFPITIAIAMTFLLFLFVAKLLNINKEMHVWKDKIKAMED